MLPCLYFPLSLYRKTVEVKIIDDEEYEKNKTFIIELGEPVLLDIGQKHGKFTFSHLAAYKWGQ